MIFDLSGIFGRTKEEQDLQKQYINTFSGPEGRKVLTDILTRLHFFDEVVGGDELVLRNFAIQLLHIMGAWQAMNTQQIVEAFLRMPIRPPEG